MNSIKKCKALETKNQIWNKADNYTINLWPLLDSQAMDQICNQIWIPLSSDIWGQIRNRVQEQIWEV